MKWSEELIARHISTQVFNNKCIILVPNCYWTGNECDVLAVTRDKRIIDIEVKISRADFKADARKDKWYHNYNFKLDGPYKDFIPDMRRPRFPQKVWKHYYAMPKDIWKPELLEHLPNQNSGILLVSEFGYGVQTSVLKPAKPCKDYELLSDENVLDIARLANIRMWTTYDKLRKAST